MTKLPDPPPGVNPFWWIVRMAPLVRAQYQAKLDSSRRAHHAARHWLPPLKERA